jgi:pimeloyl-ACP methyl ester carboxylesterase
MTMRAPRLKTGIVWLAAAVLALLVGGYLALLRPDIPYDVLERKYANGASRFVDLPGGVHFHYRDQGNRNGPTLLLVHGFGVSLETWEPWVARLGGKYRLVSVDWPGHGLTRAPDDYPPSSTNTAELIEQFARRIGLGRVTLVGNSKGGEIAWVLALRHPERVERLVLVDASGWEWRRQPPSDNPLLAFADSPVGAYLLRGLDKSSIMRRLLAAAYADPRRATAAIVRRDIELSRAPGHRAILDRTFIEGLRGRLRDGWATPEKLAAVHAPTVILWGDHDRLVDPTDGPKFAQAIRGSQLIVYQNVGHVPMEEAADKSAADLDRWLSGAQPRIRRVP